MEEHFAYFAYATNRDRRGMARRAPDAVEAGEAVLPGWRCEPGELNIYRDQESEAVGTLWFVTRGDLARLDAYESCPGWYERIVEELLLPDGRSIEAFVYHVPEKDERG